MCEYCEIVDWEPDFKGEAYLFTPLGRRAHYRLEHVPGQEWQLGSFWIPKATPISYCPICGRKLNKEEVH